MHKGGKVESFVVTCGQYCTEIQIDPEPFNHGHWNAGENLEGLHTEVASRAIEDYFKLNKDDHLLLSKFISVFNSNHIDDPEMSFVL